MSPTSVLMLTNSHLQQVIGTEIRAPNWSQTTFSPDFQSISPIAITPGGHPHFHLVQTAFLFSNACRNPYISDFAKSVTSNSDELDRWLAATEIFNSLATRGLYSELQKSSEIIVVMSGKRYMGFLVTYSDGYQEAWAVNPAYAMSSIKLLNKPMPNSIKRQGSGCLTG
jgi:hypothetical protein